MNTKQFYFFIFLNLLLASFGQVLADLYLPSVSAISHGLKVNESAVQLSIAIFIFGFAISQLLYGPFSDAFGRKLPLSIGISIAVLAQASVILLIP